MRGFRRRFSVEGLNLERFLHKAASAGIRLNGVDRTGPRRIEATVAEDALKELERCAEQGGWRFVKCGRVGAGRICERLIGRRMLLAAIFLLTIASLMASQMMWHVRIIDAGAYEPDVRTALAEMNINVPIWRSKVNTGELRDALEWRYPEVAWVEVGWRGISLEIRMVQGVQEDTGRQAGGACDVVAARDGVVERIVTRAGTPVVQAGDVVRVGEVLIRGEERTSGGEMRPVAARGSVYARVWDSVAVKTPLRVIETVYTGREETMQTVTSPWFALWDAGQTAFVHEDVSVRQTPMGGFFWPLLWQEELHMEADYRSVKTDMQSVIREGETASLQKLREQTGGGESLVDNWVNWSIIEDEILLSVATGERLVDIAQQERSSGMAATE